MSPNHATPADDGHLQDLVEQGSVDDVCEAVIEGLRFEAGDRLLDLSSASRALILEHLLDVARQRLGEMPLDRETRQEIQDLPPVLVETVFEHGNELATAIACYALLNDQYLDSGETVNSAVFGRALVCHRLAESLAERQPNREVLLAGCALGRRATSLLDEACSTLLGRSSRSSGMEGLAWAFLRAGVTQVIASRYPVDDRATVRLMSALYEGLLTLPVADALGRARDVSLTELDLSPREVGAWSVWC